MNTKIEVVEILKALADDTRYKIFINLVNQDMCACKILEDLSITQPTLSHHMKKLTSCGLVNYHKDGIWARYTINYETINILNNFFGTIIPGDPTSACCLDTKK